MRHAVAALALLALFPCAQARENDFMETRWVAILSASESFAEARAAAEKIAAKTKVPFSMEGRVFDTKKGLIFPANFPDEVYAGEYVARRFNQTSLQNKDTEYLSVERSDGYDGFKPGCYIVVAGIYDSAKEAEKQLKRFADLAPSAYAKKTKIYMGCMH